MLRKVLYRVKTYHFSSEHTTTLTMENEASKIKNIFMQIAAEIFKQSLTLLPYVFRHITKKHQKCQ